VALAVGLATAMSVGSYFAGDQLVLLSSGAKEVPVANPPDEYKQLVNVVTEMSIAGGQPMPRVHVIDDSAPNAFATGRDPKHASVAVTTGLLQKLDREQLQGVMAHEMSHVGNYDIRFTLLVGVLVGSIALLADWFLRYTFWFGGGRRGGGSRDRGGGGGAGAILFVVAILLAIIAPIIGRAVQLAVSRNRESLADVSAVELTRNPLGLARALRTISDDPEVLEVANRATQHLYIMNPVKSFEKRAKSMWDTHPPLAERIDVLRGLAGQFGQDPNLIS
jgi:heat shock protein HtpX